MMKIVLPTASFFVLFIFLAFSVNAQGSFVTQNYAVNASSSPVSPYFVGVPSFPPDPSTTCSIFFNSKTSMTSGGTFDVTVQYFSPGLTLSSQGTQTGQTTFVFKDFGTDSSSVLSPVGTYEALVKFVHSAASRDGTLNTELICSTTTSTTEIIINRSDTDSHGNYPWATKHEAEATGGSSAPTTNTSADFAEGFLVPGSRWVGETSDFQDSFGCSTGVSCAGTFLYPFNSSPSGEVHIFVNASNSTFTCEGAFTPSTKVFNIEVVKASDGSITNLFTITSTCPGATEFTSLIDTDLSLDPNNLYFLSIYGSNTHTAFASNFMTVRTPQTVNISIDTRTPNFVCPEFGECINDTRSRICVDTSGNGFTDNIEFQFCGIDLTGQEILGFEFSDSIDNVYECEGTGFFPFCSETSIGRSVSIPTGWTPSYISAFDNISNATSLAPHFIEVNSEKASAGVRSLKMWWITPGIQTVFSQQPSGEILETCSNVSFTPLQELTRGINSSILTNITFSSTNTKITYDVAKISEPVSRTQPQIFCGEEQCYGGCGSETLGLYKIKMTDTTNGGTIFQIEDDVTSKDFILRTFDLSNAGITTDTNYTLEISLDPVDGNDARAIGIHMDNLRIEETITPINCTSVCDGTNLIQATLQGGACIIQEVVNDSSCIAIIDAALEAEQAQSFEPITFIQNVFDNAGLNQTVLDENNAGFVTFFFSPLFIALAIFVLIGGVLEYKVAAGSQSSGAKGLIFGVVLILGTVLLTSLGIMPIGFAILFVVISGALVVNVIMKSVFSSG